MNVKSIIWGYVSQFLQYGAALLVLPILLRKLSSPEMGIWYVLMTISALVAMFDMGFTPTLARNVSYILSGTRGLQKDGYNLAPSGADVDYSLMQAVIVASRRIFLCISVIAVAFLTTAGTWYIFLIAKGQVRTTSLKLTWVIFVIATVLNIYFKYYTPLLQGRGYFAQYYRANAVASIGFVASTAILLYSGWGLVGVAIGYLVQSLLGRMLSWRYFYDKEMCSHLRSAPAYTGSIGQIVMVLWHNAWRLGVGVIGAFLILRANTLLASAYLGLATTATYALTLQVFSTIENMSTIAFNIQLQRIAKHRVTSNENGVLRLTEIGIASSLMLYFLGIILVVYVGRPLILLIKSNTHMLDQPLLYAVALMLLLELNHSLAANVIMTRNTVPFVNAAVGSGIAIVLGSFIGLRYLHMGVSWIIATQLIVQASYNNWRWPLMLSQDLGRSYPGMVIEGAGATLRAVRTISISTVNTFVSRILMAFNPSRG